MNMKLYGTYLIGLLLFGAFVGGLTWLFAKNRQIENGFEMCQSFCGPGHPARIEMGPLPKVVSCACYAPGMKIEMQIE